MPPTWTPIQVGEELDGYPASSHSFFGESIEELQAFTNAPQPQPKQNLFDHPTVSNHTGEEIFSMFPVLRIEEPTLKPADHIMALSGGIHMIGKTPDAGTVTDLKFAILQEPAQVNQAIRSVMVGPSWVKLDVADEALDHAEPIDGDATKLKASSSGVPIRWKETGIGEKWGIVLLGAAGATTTRDAIAMITVPIPAASALDGTAKTATTGQAAGAATLMDYKRDANGDHIQPPVDLEAKQEDDPNFVQTVPPTPSSEIPQVDVVRDVVNYSETEFRASVVEPILVPGRLRKVGDTELFEIMPNWDIRSLPEFDRTKKQIAYTPANDGAGKLGGKECPPATP